MKILRVLIIVFTLSFAFGCGGGSSDPKEDYTKITQAENGDRYYGGIFKMNETEYLRSLYPLNVTEVVGHRICNQLYEGLVMLNQGDLSIKPALAESWEIDSTATVYTFNLRKGVKFHQDECFPADADRTVTAHRFKYSLDRLCSFDVNNKGYDFIKERIKGAPEHYEATKKGETLEGGCSGIQVIDDYTLRIELTKPFASFLHILAMPFGYVFPQEAYDKYGIEMRIKTVGTGPFQLKKVKEKDAVIMVRNEEYWGKDEFGNQLPYLKGIRFSFIGDQKAELLSFKKGDLDMVFRLPLEMTDEVTDRKGGLKGEYKQYVLQEEPSMSFQYYGFKVNGDMFGDKRVRQAFNYAVDRQKIVDYTLKGAGVPAFYGVAPPAFPHYKHEDIKGYGFDPGKSKQLMAEAGYPSGEGFPEVTLQINSGGTRNEQVAEAVQKMLNENLGVTVKITKMPFAQHLEAIETSKTDFWRAGWIADYPDPENFITLFWSKHIPPKLTDRSYLNTWRFKSDKFDAFYEEALRTIDDEKRNDLYRQADQVVIDEAVVIPLFYDKDQRLLQPDVRNYPQNAMEYRNLRDVYFVPAEE